MPPGRRVLHLGNVDFEDDPDDNRGGCRVTSASENSLRFTAGLVGLDPDDLRRALTARVITNRIWMHHFGQPLVRTPSDFGVRGAACGDLAVRRGARRAAVIATFRGLHAFDVTEHAFDTPETSTSEDRHLQAIRLVGLHRRLGRLDNLLAGGSRDRTPAERQCACGNH